MNGSLKRLLAVWFCVACLSSLALGQETKLHYFVVDRSKSIDDKGFTKVLQERIVENVNTLGTNDEVRIVFFNSSADGRRVWEGMDWDAKLEFDKHLNQYMKPSGRTRLYDTVVEVVREIQASNNDYQTVRVMILSDGEDNESRRARSWQDVHPLAKTFKTDQPNSLITLFTLGYEPKQLPDPELIEHRDVPDPLKEKNLFVQKPSADFKVVPAVVQVGDPVTFVHLASIGQVESYAWSFGDDSGSQDQAPSHTYAQPGQYRIQLKVEGPGGDATSVESVEVTPGPPPFKAEADWFPRDPRVGEPVRFLAKVNRTDTEVHWVIAGRRIEMASPELAFEQTGEVEVVLVASGEGESGRDRQSLTIRPLPPTADFTVEPSGEIPLGDSLRLQADKTDSEWKHSWRLAGQTVLEGPTVTWTTEESGLVEVVHFVEGPGGAATAFDRILVQAPAGPVAMFTTEPAVAVSGQPVILTAMENRDGATFQWTVAGETYQSRSVEVVPETPGELTAELSVEFVGKTSTHRQVVPVVEGNLVVERIEAAPAKGTLPLEVAFSVETSGGAVARYAWSFGDGATSADAAPTHIFEQAGEHEVRVTVWNASGKSTESPFSEVVRVKAPLPTWIIWGPVAALVLLALLIAAWKFRPRPVPETKVNWEYNGEFGSGRLDEAKPSLATLEIPGWAPSRELKLKNIRGSLWLTRDGIEVKEVPNGKPIELDGLRATFKW